MLKHHMFLFVFEACGRQNIKNANGLHVFLTLVDMKTLTNLGCLFVVDACGRQNAENINGFY